MTIDEEIRQQEEIIRKAKRKLNRLLLKKDLEQQRIMGQIHIEEVL